MNLLKQKAVGRKSPKETTKHVWPQCEFLNPFILEKTGIVIVWFLSLNAVVFPVWSPDQQHPGITWELVRNVDLGPCFTCTESETLGIRAGHLGFNKSSG